MNQADLKLSNLLSKQLQNHNDLSMSIAKFKILIESMRQQFKQIEPKLFNLAKDESPCKSLLKENGVIIDTFLSSIISTVGKSEKIVSGFENESMEFEVSFLLIKPNATKNHKISHLMHLKCQLITLSVK